MLKKCKICDLFIDNNNKNKKVPITNLHTKSTGYSYRTILESFFDKSSMVYFSDLWNTTNDNDNFICKTCEHLIEYYDKFYYEAKICFDLILRQLHRSLKISQFENVTESQSTIVSDKFARLTHHDNDKDMLDTFKKQLDVFYCRKCNYKTMYSDTLVGHYKYHTLPEITEIKIENDEQAALKDIHLESENQLKSSSGDILQQQQQHIELIELPELLINNLSDFVLFENNGIEEEINDSVVGINHLKNNITDDENMMTKPNFVDVLNDELNDDEPAPSEINDDASPLPTKCLYCNVMLSNRTQLEIHYADKHLFCLRCNEKFAKISYLRRHQFTNKHTGLYNCHVCNTKFKTKILKHKHVCQRKSTKLIQKAITGQIFTGKCKYCGKQFNIKSNLKRHERIHENKNESTLEKNVVPLVKNQLETIEIEKVNDIEERNEIEETNNSNVLSFIIADEEEKHLCEKVEATTGPERLRRFNGKCRYCGKQFNIKSNLKRHERIHENKNESTLEKNVVPLVKNQLETIEIEKVNDIEERNEIEEANNSNVLIEHRNVFIADEEEEHLCEKVEATKGPERLRRFNGKCRYCGKEFQSKSSLKRHEAVHESKKQLPRKFTAVEKNDIEETSDFTAAILIKNMNDVIAYERQITELYHPDGISLPPADDSIDSKPKCLYKNCDSPLGDLTQLERHYSTVHLWCVKCNLKFTKRNDIRNHLNSIQHKRLYKCHYCTTTFKTKILNIEHSCEHKAMLKAKKEKTFIGKCKYCEKHLNTKRSLRIHEWRHERPPEFVCVTCGLKFNHSATFRLHERYHISSKPFPCTICSAKLSSHSSWTVHMRIHTDERPYKCEYCDSAFRTGATKKIHVIDLHTKEYKLKCDVCGKGFTRHSGLRQHKIKVHKLNVPTKKCEYKLTIRKTKLLEDLE